LVRNKQGYLAWISMLFFMPFFHSQKWKDSLVCICGCLKNIGNKESCIILAC